MYPEEECALACFYTAFSIQSQINTQVILVFFRVILYSSISTKCSISIITLHEFMHRNFTTSMLEHSINLKSIVIKSEVNTDNLRLQTLSFKCYIVRNK